MDSFEKQKNCFQRHNPAYTEKLDDKTASKLRE